MKKPIKLNMDDVSDMLDKMPNNRAIRFVSDADAKNRYEIELLTLEHFKEHNRRADKLNITCLLLRKFAADFCQKLECEYYKPGTAQNKLFGCMYLRWNNFIYCIVSIPIADKLNAEKIAQQIGCRLVDGIPTILSNNLPDPKSQIAGIPAELFPLNNTNTWNLEDGISK